jgi:hypothetical protein
MATRYQKRFHPLPGLRINMSKPWKVSSITLGRPGFVSTTIGSGRKRLNVDLPGGYSWRKAYGDKPGEDNEQQERKATDNQSREEKAVEPTTFGDKLRLIFSGFTVGGLAFGTPLGGMLLGFIF